MAGKRILVTGPESSGTKMMSAQLRQLGRGDVDVTHSSPNYLLWDGRKPHKAEEFDYVIVLVRSWYPNIQSMIEAGHTDGELRGRVMAAGGLLYILQNLGKLDNVYVITYEEFTGPNAEKAMDKLCEALGIKYNPLGIEKGRDGNAKYYGGEYFRDQRQLHER